MQQNNYCYFTKNVNNEGAPGTTGMTALVTVFEGGQSKWGEALWGNNIWVLLHLLDNKLNF